MENHDKVIIETLISQNASLAAKVGQLESENNNLRIHHSGFEKYFSDESLTFYRRHRSEIYRLQFKQEATANIGELQNRRETFITLISKQAGCEHLTVLHPHNGMGRRIRVLLLGSGGMGDCLILTHFAAQLRSYLPLDYLAVGFEGQQIHDIFSGTGLADATLALTSESRNALFSICSSLDVFDIVIDVRYAALAFFPPLSRVSQQTQQLVQRQGEAWYRYNAFDWPHLNHSFAVAAIAQGLNAYSIFSHSLGLPHDDCIPALDIEPVNSAQLQQLSTLGRPMVCVGIGSDAKMATARGLSTKSIPHETISEVIDRLNADGYLTVQLGMAHEPALLNVGMDLRGQLSIRQSAGVLKASLCFIGVEGGIVHLARAVGTPSVVCFGPTPSAFFGYPGNINLQTTTCTPCWWTSREWMTRCISTQSKQGCMTSITTDSIIAGVTTLRAKRQHTFELRIISVPETGVSLAGYSIAAQENSPWHESRGFAGLLSNRFIAQGEGAPVLARTNIAQTLDGEGCILINADDTELLLKLMNAPQLLNASTSIAVARINEGTVTGSSFIELAPLLKQCESGFLAKDWKLTIKRPKKIAKTEKFILELRTISHE